MQEEMVVTDILDLNECVTSCGHYNCDGGCTGEDQCVCEDV